MDEEAASAARGALRGRCRVGGSGAEPEPKRRNSRRSAVGGALEESPSEIRGFRKRPPRHPGAPRGSPTGKSGSSGRSRSGGKLTPEASPDAATGSSGTRSRDSADAGPPDDHRAKGRKTNRSVRARAFAGSGLPLHAGGGTRERKAEERVGEAPVADLARRFTRRLVRRLVRRHEGPGNDRRPIPGRLGALPPASPGRTGAHDREGPPEASQNASPGAAGTRSRDSADAPAGAVCGRRGPGEGSEDGPVRGEAPLRLLRAPALPRLATVRSGPGGGRLRRLRRRWGAPRPRVPRRRGPGCPPPPRGRRERRGRRSSARRRGPRVRRRNRR